jgi:hypothetical protein
MIARSTKLISIAALCLLLGLLWQGGTETPALFASFAVWAGAMVVLISALSERKYWWGAAFGGIAIIFNPAMPVSLSRQAFIALYLGCIVMFACSLSFIKTRPRLSPASITNPEECNEAL